MRHRIIAILTVTFFLGFPGFGLYYFWIDAHRRVQRSAEPFVRKASAEILANWDGKLLDDLGTLQLRDSKAEQQLEAMRPRMGAFKQVSNWKVVESLAGDRGNTMWQFVGYSADAEFEKGPARLHVIVARRTMNPEWRIEEFRVMPR